MLRPTRLVLVAATLAATACSARGPVPGAVSTADLDAFRALDASARAEAARDLEGMAGAGELGLAESGFSAETFRSVDKDGDGKLGIAEKAAMFKAVWSGMQAIADSRETVAQEQADTERPDPGQEYTVAHPLQYAPVDAQVFIDAAEIMPAVFNTLSGAQRTIRMDVFLLGGTQGQKLAELLVAKAKAGVDVRILHDPGYGLAGTAHAQIVPVMRYLVANGVSVKSYPLSYLKRRRGHPLANRFQIDHDKLVIVDREVAMCGTMNLIDIGVMNHDLYVRVQGQPAEELAAILDATWQL